MKFIFDFSGSWRTGGGSTGCGLRRRQLLLGFQVCSFIDFSACKHTCQVDGVDLIQTLIVAVVVAAVIVELASGGCDDVAVRVKKLEWSCNHPTPCLPCSLSCFRCRLTPEKRPSPTHVILSKPLSPPAATGQQLPHRFRVRLSNSFSQPCIDDAVLVVRLHSSFSLSPLSSCDPCSSQIVKDFSWWPCWSDSYSDLHLR
mmetsp:Transcript_30350/g.80463  ORF Transcript_30350/g.80463 Transcript_30350/m.80463 type:complete len:200 (-) Transcript_30350:709-1308(-)